MEQMEQQPQKAEIKTEKVLAGELKNGDIIFIDNIEYDVIDVDHQRQNSHIKVQNRNGEVSEIYAYDRVDRAIL